MTSYFENLKLHIIYVFNTYVKCSKKKTYVKICVNHILFIIQSINLFFMNNFRLQKT